jgi:hypothetical protein
MTYPVYTYIDVRTKLSCSTWNTSQVLGLGRMADVDRASVTEIEA